MIRSLVQAAKQGPGGPTGLVLGEGPLGESIGRQIEGVSRPPLSGDDRESVRVQSERGGSIGRNEMRPVVELVRCGDRRDGEKLVGPYVKEAAVADSRDLPGAAEGLRGLSVANRQPDECSVGSPPDLCLQVPRHRAAGHEAQPAALQAFEAHPAAAVPPSEEASPLPRKRGFRRSVSNGAVELGKISPEHPLRKERILVLALIVSALRRMKRLSTDPH